MQRQRRISAVCRRRRRVNRARPATIRPRKGAKARRRDRRVNRADHRYHRHRANVARDRVATPAPVRTRKKATRRARRRAALVNLITRESRAPLEGGHQPGAMRADCS